MAIQKDVLINVKSQFANAGMPELRNALKQTQLELDNLRKTGQQGTAVWDATKSKALALSQVITGLGREYRGLDANTKMSNLSILEMGENITVVVQGFKQALSSIKGVASEYLKAANDMQSATLGLESIAKFKGIDSTVAIESLKNMDLVKNGLLSLSEASLATKNLMAAGFSLEESIELIKRFGDSAAFGRQSSLSFGQAITSATEGLKNQNSILVDNAGVTKNISVIMKEGGMSMQDLTDETKKNAAIQVLYKGILKETNGQLGDAEKLTKTFAGEQAKLEAQLLQSKQKLGELTQQSLKPFLEVITSLPEPLQVVAVALGGVTKTGLELLPVIAQMKMAFPTLGTAIINALGPASAAFLAIWAIYELIMEIKHQIDVTNEAYKKIDQLKKEEQPQYESNASSDATDYKGNMNIMTFEEMEEKGIVNSGYENVYPNGTLPEKPEDIKKKSDFVSKGRTNNLKEEKEKTDDLTDSTKKLTIARQEEQKRAQEGIYDNLGYQGRTKLYPADKDKKALSANEPDYDYQKAGEKVQAILDTATQTANILGLGADTFIGKMLSGFSQILGLADSVINLLMKFGAMGANAGTGGIFGIIGSLFGFASGGYISGAGTSTSDSILARLSNGEYVVNAKSTKQYLPLLEAINGNYDNIRKYADGGRVIPNVNVNQPIYLAGAMEGQTFYRINKERYDLIQSATLIRG